MRIAVQPCGDSDAQQHYVDTIANPVPASRIRPHLTPVDRDRFDKVLGTRAAVWGVTPGKLGQNEKKWQRLEPGDIAFLYRDKKIFSTGRIVQVVHSRDLALELWGTNSDGATWEFIYFLDDLQEVEIPIALYNQALDYKSNNIVQGFQVHTEEQSALLFDLLQLDSRSAVVDRVAQQLSEVDLAKRLSELKQLDQASQANARAEASLFREYLFGGRDHAGCAICGRVLPTDLLVAAHIKPRANCSDEERRDPRVVMRACRLGCDELFERSFISVDGGGKVVAMPALGSATQGLKDFAQALVGRPCSAHDERTRQYFKWRSEHPRRVLKLSE